MSHNIAATRESHSELGAAHELLGNVWERLRPDRIELPLGSTSDIVQGTRDQDWRLYLSERLAKLWRNFLQYPMDIATSILWSMILVGIFVAESSGSVASARIVSDTTAKIVSSNCSILTLRLAGRVIDLPANQALRYAQKCYNTPLGSDGCNDFHNQSIGYTERSNPTCPFSGDTCAEGRYAAITFDSGYVHAKTIALNSTQTFYFRRSTTCAPLVPNSREFKVYDDGTMIHYNVFNCAGGKAARDLIGRGYIQSFVRPIQYT